MKLLSASKLFYYQIRNTVINRGVMRDSKSGWWGNNAMVNRKEK